MATVEFVEEEELGQEPTDEALMLEYRATENQEAFRTLVKRYEGSLYGCLMNSGVVDRQLAEQIFMDTWLRVHKMRHLFEPGMQFNSWLTEIAIARGSLALALRSKERKVV